MAAKVAGCAQIIAVDPNTSRLELARELGATHAIDMNSIMFGRSLRGIIEGDSVSDVFIPRLIELYKQGRFPFDRLVTFYKLEDINTAVEDTEQGKVIKAVLRP
jgi:aryl-alcohol dehydrogenase